MIYFIGANCSGRLQGMFYLTQEGTEQFQSYPPFLYSFFFVVLKKWGQSIYCAKKNSFHLVSRIYFQCYCQYLVVVGSKHLFQCLKTTVRQSKEKLLFLQILVMQTQFIQSFYQIIQDEKNQDFFFYHYNFEVFSQCNSLILIFIHCHFNIVFIFSMLVCMMNTTILTHFLWQLKLHLHSLPESSRLNSF